jgi:hypothetical protein
VLVSAAFTTDDGAVLTLVFDRAVTLVPGALTTVSVTDGPGGNLFDGSGGAVLADPVTAVVSLVLVDFASGPDVTLDAPTPTGVRGDPDGLEWTGVTGLVLPFG